MTNKQATRAPRIIVSNVFGDVNRGGAANTAQTIRVAQAACARGIGVTIVHEFPDIVFGMDPPDTASVRQKCAVFGLIPGRNVTMTVVLPPDEVGREQLTRALAETAGALRSDPRVEKVVLVDQVGDGLTTASLAESIKDDCVVVDAHLSPEDLIALYGGSLLTVVCRLYSAIFFFAAGTPAVAVAILPDQPGCSLPRGYRRTGLSRARKRTSVLIEHWRCSARRPSETNCNNGWRPSRSSSRICSAELRMYRACGARGQMDD